MSDGNPYYEDESQVIVQEVEDNPLTDELLESLLKLYYYYRDPRKRTMKTEGLPDLFNKHLSTLDLSGTADEICKRYERYLRNSVENVRPFF